MDGGRTLLNAINDVLTSNIIPRIRIHAHVGDGLNNLALLDLSSVLTDCIDLRQRCSNVNADVRYVDFTHMSVSGRLRLTASTRTLYSILVDAVSCDILKPSSARFYRLSPVLACRRRRFTEKS